MEVLPGSGTQNESDLTAPTGWRQEDKNPFRKEYPQIQLERTPLEPPSRSWEESVVAPTTHTPKDHRKRQEEGQMDLIQREGHHKRTKPTVATPKPKHTRIQSQNPNYDPSKDP